MAKKKSVRNAYICAALAGILACSGPGSMTAWAEEELYQAVDGNQIAEERLRDQTVEYEELGSLIHANNVTVQNAAGKRTQRIWNIFALKRPVPGGIRMRRRTKEIW